MIYSTPLLRNGRQRVNVERGEMGGLTVFPVDVWREDRESRTV